MFFKKRITLDLPLSRPAWDCSHNVITTPILAIFTYQINIMDLSGLKNEKKYLYGKLGQTGEFLLWINYSNSHKWCLLRWSLDMTCWMAIFTAASVDIEIWHCTSSWSSSILFFTFIFSSMTISFYAHKI